MTIKCLLREVACNFGSRKSEDDDSHGKKKKELLQEKLEVSENLIKSLQSEVLALREELDRVKSLNVELESQNTKLTQNLAAAEAKISNVGIGNNGKVRICYVLPQKTCTLNSLPMSLLSVVFLFCL